MTTAIRVERPGFNANPRLYQTLRTRVVDHRCRSARRTRLTAGHKVAPMAPKHDVILNSTHNAACGPSRSVDARKAGREDGAERKASWRAWRTLWLNEKIDVNRRRPSLRASLDPRSIPP